MTREEQLEHIRNDYDMLRYHHDYDHWYRRGNIRDWLRFVRRSPKRIRDRAKRGYCGADLWDFGEYLMLVIATGLREFAEKSIGTPTEYCPDDADYDTAHEVWKEEMLDIVRKIEDIMVESRVGGWTPEQYAEKNKEVFDWLAKHRDDLWE